MKAKGAGFDKKKIQLLNLAVWPKMFENHKDEQYSKILYLK